ncbi:hypothetical protein F5B20DRAFT_585698 [Whalleya microplaca]|nr:hypothetical protein F5B20DRAFT_585698 [Whalleya microplaca]
MSMKSMLSVSRLEPPAGQTLEPNPPEVPAEPVPQDRQCRARKSCTQPAIPGRKSCTYHHNERSNNLRRQKEHRKSMGLCVLCGEPIDEPGFVQCSVCRARGREWSLHIDPKDMTPKRKRTVLCCGPGCLREIPGRKPKLCEDCKTNCSPARRAQIRRLRRERAQMRKLIARTEEMGQEKAAVLAEVPGASPHQEANESESPCLDPEEGEAEDAPIASPSAEVTDLQ